MAGKQPTDDSVFVDEIDKGANIARIIVGDKVVEVPISDVPEASRREGASYRKPGAQKAQAFDPKAFLADTSHFDPKAFLSETAPAAPDRQAQIDAKIKAGLLDVPGMSKDEALANAKSDKLVPTLSPWASAGIHAANEGLLGFGDELAGAVGSLTSDKTYKQARDEVRDSLHYAEDVNPKAAMAGGLAGAVGSSFLPGLRVAYGAKLASTIGRAALAGGLSGLGSSESEDMKGQLLDTGKGALISGGLAGVTGKIFQGAGKRVAKNAIGEITQGETESARRSIAKKIGANAGPDGETFHAIMADSPETAKALATKAATNPKAAAQQVTKRLDEIGQRTDQIYGNVEIPTADVLARLDGLKAEYGKRLQATMHREAGAVRDMFEEVAQQRPTVLLSDLRNFATDVGKGAFAKDPLVAKDLKARAWKQMYREIVGAIEDTAQAAGRPVDELKSLNKQSALLIDAGRALNERAELKAANHKGLAEVLAGNGSVGLGAAGAMMGALQGHPGTGAALGLAVPLVRGAYRGVVKPAIRSADYQLARVGNSAAAGNIGAQALQNAGSLGFGLGTLSLDPGIVFARARRQLDEEGQ